MLEVESVFGSANQVVLFFNAVELPLEYIYDIHGRIGTHTPLHWTSLLPLLQDICYLIFYDFILSNYLQLKTS